MAMATTNGKILVTGGAGYIGSILVEDLLREGWSVTVLDSFLYQENSLAHLCSNPRFKIVSADVRSSQVMTSLLKEADIIIPLAALVGAPLCEKDPVGATTTNRDAILWMLKNLSPSQWVIMPTTNSGYGVGEPGAWCTEASPLRPLSHYAREKVEVESAVLSHSNAVSFRLATVFGMSPRMRIDLLVNDFVYRAVKDRFLVLFEAQFRRNFIHVRDVSLAFRLALKKFDQMRGQAFNVGLSDANLSKYQLCERIQKHLPKFYFVEAKVGEDPDKRDYLVSNEKIEKLGFAPQVGLDAGIQELIKGYQMIQNNRYGNV